MKLVLTVLFVIATVLSSFAQFSGQRTYRLSAKLSGEGAGAASYTRSTDISSLQVEASGLKGGSVYQVYVGSYSFAARTSVTGGFSVSQRLDPKANLGMRSGTGIMVVDNSGRIVLKGVFE